MKVTVVSLKPSDHQETDLLLLQRHIHTRTDRRVLWTDVGTNGVLVVCCSGDEARGYERGRLDRLELEDGGGHNGKWSVLRAVGGGAE